MIEDASQVLMEHRRDEAAGALPFLDHPFSLQRNDTIYWKTIQIN